MMCVQLSPQFIVCDHRLVIFLVCVASISVGVLSVFRFLTVWILGQ